MLQRSPRGENLVHFNNAVAHHLYRTWEKENISTPDKTVNLVDVLCEALGVKAPLPAVKENTEYKKLMTATYLTQFHRALQKIISQKLEADERGPLMDAEVDILQFWI